MTTGMKKALAIVEWHLKLAQTEAAKAADGSMLRDVWSMKASAYRDIEKALRKEAGQ